jgi:hypothetical protein
MICLGCDCHFNQSANLPLILPECGHTICKKCITENFTSKKLTCLECGYSYILDSISNLPKNMTLIRMQSDYPSQPPPTPGTPISKKTPKPKTSSKPKFFINDGLSYKTMPPPISVSQTLESTKKINQKNLKNSKPKKVPPKLCHLHQKEIEGFCETDKILICVECVFEEHKGHDIFTLTKANEKHLEKCAEFGIFLEDEIESISRRKSEIGLAQDDMNNTYN